MIAMIAPENSKGQATVQPYQKSCDDHEKSRKTRRYKIDHVIQPGGELSKVEVAFGAIANHGVQCVNSFIDHGHRNPSQKKIEERSDDSIVGIFRQRFQTCAQNLVLIQSGGLTADDVSQILARFNKIV